MNNDNCLLKYIQTIEEWRGSSNNESEEFKHLNNQTFLDHAANAIYMAS